MSGIKTIIFCSTGMMNYSVSEIFNLLLFFIAFELYVCVDLVKNSWCGFWGRGLGGRDETRMFGCVYLECVVVCE